MPLLTRRATVEPSPLVVGPPGDSSLEARELDLGNTLDSGVQVLGGSLSVDASEVVRWFNGVLSGTRLGEAVRSED